MVDQPAFQFPAPTRDGLAKGDVVRWKVSARIRVKARVVGWNVDGSLDLREIGGKGAAYALRPGVKNMERKTTGPRGATVWTPIPRSKP